MIALVLAAPVVLVVFAAARAAWRLVVRNDEAEPGGSYGRQMLERDD